LSDAGWETSTCLQKGLRPVFLGKSLSFVQGTIKYSLSAAISRNHFAHTVPLNQQDTAGTVCRIVFPGEK
jgi:hypothetical protein